MCQRWKRIIEYRETLQKFIEEEPETFPDYKLALDELNQVLAPLAQKQPGMGKVIAYLRRVDGLRLLHATESIRSYFEMVNPSGETKNQFKGVSEEEINLQRTFFILQASMQLAITPEKLEEAICKESVQTVLWQKGNHRAAVKVCAELGIAPVTTIENWIREVRDKSGSIPDLPYL